MKPPPRYPIAAVCVLLAVGCSPDEEDPAGDFDATAVVSEAVPTVATVTFDPGVVPASAHVAFGPDATYGALAPVDLTGDTPYEVLLLGNKPGVEIHFEVVVEADGETLSSGDNSFITGSVPTSMPDVAVEAADPDLAAGGFLVSSLVAAPPSAVIPTMTSRLTGVV